MFGGKKEDVERMVAVRAEEKSSIGFIKDNICALLQELQNIWDEIGESKEEFQAPCRTTKNPCEILQLSWYRGAVPQMVMAGFLPFSVIYIELYYIFASIWGHIIYAIYSILFVVFIILPILPIIFFS